MKTYPLCLACLLQQAHRTVQLITSDKSEHNRFIQAVADYVAHAPVDGVTAAEYTTPMYQMAAKWADWDIYREVKERQNRLALSLLPHIEAVVRAQSDPLAAAARMAAAGNLIDSGVGVPEDVERSLLAAIDRPFGRDESASFFAHLGNGTRSLLYICDNAGEIVFDELFVRLLKETYPRLRVTAVVKEAPILNDATRADALAVGLDKAADVLITTGTAMVGVPLGSAGDEFLRALESTDLFLSKGQGNFETLDEHPGGYLILTAKCSAVAEVLGTEEGEMVFVESKSGAENK